MKVSTVITTHNRIDVLPRAIKSVLNQTHKDIELIIVSDGSTDGTEEYLSSLKANLNIKIISYYPGKGGNYARNQGIMAATGNWIAFLDDDDEWMPTKIEKQLAKFQENEKLGLVYVGKNIIYVDENKSYISGLKMVEDPSKSILYENFIGSTSAVMVKTDLVKKVGMFDEELNAIQDYDLWIRVCQMADIDYVDEPLLNYYNKRGGSQISDYSHRYEAAYKYIADKYHSLYSKLSDKEISAICCIRLTGLAIRCIRNNNSKTARHYINRAFKIKPGIKYINLYIISFMPFSIILRIRAFLKLTTS